MLRYLPITTTFSCPSAKISSTITSTRPPAISHVWTLTHHTTTSTSKSTPKTTSATSTSSSITKTEVIDNFIPPSRGRGSKIYKLNMLTVFEHKTYFLCFKYSQCLKNIYINKQIISALCLKHFNSSISTDLPLKEPRPLPFPPDSS